MIAWLTVVMRIALLQAGPQDLPSDRSSLIFALIFYGLVATTFGVAVSESRPMSLLLLSFVIQISMVFTLLQINGQLDRFNQTASAVFATAALLGLVTLPLWLMAKPPIPPGLALLLLGSLFWSLAVDGSIWRHALNRSFGFGLAVSVLLFVIHFSIMQSFGPPANGG